MKKYTLLALVFIILSCSQKADNEIVVVDNPIEHQSNSYGFNPSDFRIVEGEVRRGDFFGTLLMKLGASGNQTQQLVNASKNVFDVTKIRIGNSYEVFYSSEEDSLAYFIYERDRTSNVLFSLKDSVFVKVIEKEIVPQTKFAEVTITSSLWYDVVKAGCSDQLALKLSDIYDCTIDFFGLQKGDSFRVIYDDLIHDGNFIGFNQIYYAEFVHDGKVFKAIRYDDSETGSKYWNENGESLKKAPVSKVISFLPYVLGKSALIFS